MSDSGIAAQFSATKGMGGAPAGDMQGAREQLPCRRPWALDQHGHARVAMRWALRTLRSICGSSPASSSSVSGDLGALAGANCMTCGGRRWRATLACAPDRCRGRGSQKNAAQSQHRAPATTRAACRAALGSTSSVGAHVEDLVDPAADQLVAIRRVRAAARPSHRPQSPWHPGERERAVVLQVDELRAAHGSGTPGRAGSGAGTGISRSAAPRGSPAPSCAPTLARLSRALSVDASSTATRDPAGSRIGAPEQESPM